MQVENDEIRKESLAQAGFYYDAQNQAVCCYCCGVIIPLNDESLQYQPWILHAR